ncbi:hypothetical protein HID58_010471 [Brassica napus]|uniref:N-acetyltransferase domain-containing protein n=1 Tax=Brassica napus TaxID=3708 RepID=A0ABQ8DVK8_BRANA|nr:hypothetical protein HID58_010471 [Brassica napus]
MATAIVMNGESKKQPRPGRGGFQGRGLTEEEARVRAISEIVSTMIERSHRNENVDLNAIKTQACRKYGLARAPKLVEMIAALPDSERETLLPKLRAKPVRTASGIAVVAVMSKPHRCPHIATTGNICVYCPGGPDSDFEYSTQSYTGYEPTSMRAIRARYNPYVQARSRIDQLKRLGHSVDKVEFILMGGTFMSLPAEYRDFFIRNLHDALSGYTSANVEEADIHHKIKPEQVELVRRDYTANQGWETFLSYEDTRQDILVGLLRLRKCGKNVTCPELMGKCSVVRELHVYGTAVPVHGREADKLQHQGYGTLLMEEAERIARREHRSNKIGVISGVGTRHYYRKLGYELEGPYMVKHLL